MFVYRDGQDKTVQQNKNGESDKMSDVKSALRMVGMILLAIFVLSVTIPLVFKAVGITFAILGFLVWLAMQLIYLAVVIAVAYLLLVGIRALLR
jgi:hypothetical protein